MTPERYGYVQTGPHSWRPRNPITEPPLVVKHPISFTRDQPLILEVWCQHGQYIMWLQRDNRVERWIENIQDPIRGDAIDLDGPAEKATTAPPHQSFERDRIWINGELVGERCK